LLPLIKSYVQEERNRAAYKKSNDAILAQNRRLVRMQSMLSPLVQFLAVVGILTLLWHGTGLFQSESASPGQLVSLVLYGMLLTRPVSGFANIYGEVLSLAGASERLMDVMQESTETNEGFERITGVEQVIEFRDIHFSYPERQPLFEGIDLQVRRHEVVAITGANGTGKSTLVKMLARFATPQAGTISIDGIDINRIRLGNLREQIAFVHQDTYLINGTVADNILYGRISASKSEMVRAAQLAQAFQFIKRLPRQFDTVIGDEGVLVSGGEKQRIALARALLADRPILVLDEATSMFDARAEQLIVENLDEIFRNRTVILISHNEVLLNQVDRVISIEKGYLQEQLSTAGISGR
jgi:ATP-binding cassette, subfamily B, bacterial